MYDSTCKNYHKHISVWYLVHVAILCNICFESGVAASTDTYSLKAIFIVDTTLRIMLSYIIETGVSIIL